MTDHEFDAIRKLVRERSAIALEDDKQYLVEARLAPLLRERRLNSIGELIAQLGDASANGLYQRIVEAMVTTETSFFRDRHPFDALRTTVIPELIERRRTTRQLNLWCAASSSGQEPYSIAILIREHFPELAGWRISFQATDISNEMTARSREGIYSQFEVNRGLPATLLVKYFEQHGTQWQLRPIVRNMVEFRQMNLAKPWQSLPAMDLVLLRNVMIYFDLDTKKSILGRVRRLLKPDGYLLVGGSETTFNIDSSFRRVESLKSGFYQLAQ